MPRHGKGARLWLRAARRKDGRTIANAVWIIIDGSRHRGAGPRPALCRWFHDRRMRHRAHAVCEVCASRAGVGQMTSQRNEDIR